MARRIVIVGAGISGLAAARAAADRAGELAGGLEVVVLERDDHVGGKVRSVNDGEGWLVEEGPTGFLDNEPALDRLIASAGLEKQPADEASAHRFLVRGGRMREIHAHPAKFLGSGLMGPLGILRLAMEPWIKAKRDGEDETIWDFGARRLGRQAADRLIAPMVLGVFAGDAKRLSLPSAFPKMRAMEEEHGSLVRAMFAKKREARSEGREAGGPAGPAGWLTSFEGGLQQLPLRLAEAPDLEVHLDAPVSAIERAPESGYRVRFGHDEWIHADALVLSGEPWAMGPLARGLDDELARLLERIECPPVNVVALGFGESALQKTPRGFGVLIPRGEGYRILGALWDSMIFPGRAPEGGLLVRAMLGGAVDVEAGAIEDHRLIDIVRRDLKTLMRIDETPIFRHVARWPRAIPQYLLGHRERVAALEDCQERLPGLFLAGNALDGIAFGKAALRGVQMGEKALDYLVARQRESP